MCSIHAWPVRLLATGLYAISIFVAHNIIEQPVTHQPTSSGTSRPLSSPIAPCPALKIRQLLALSPWMQGTASQGDYWKMDESSEALSRVDGAAAPRRL